MANDDSRDSLDFGRFARAARRQIWIFLLFCCLGCAGGAIYLARAVPRYTATTVMVIDSAKDKSGLAATIADLTYDSGAIDSQLEVLKSENVARAVVNNLKIGRDAAPLPQASGWLSFAEGLFSFVEKKWLKKPTPASPAATASSDNQRARDLISQLQSNLDVRRVGRSYVINIDYTSPDPIQAARISSAFAEAYIGDQLEARFESMRRTSSWLEQKIAEVKQKSIESDLAIQRFKVSNDILTADNRLINDQQLSELSSQLVTAKSELARSEARYAQIRNLMSANNIPAVVTDTLGSPVITELRKKYLEAAGTEAELSSALGPDHMQAQKLRRTMYELSVLIFNEMSRIAASYRSDAEVARARETSLETSLSQMATRNTGTDEAVVRWRDLQRDSESYKSLYATYVQRLQLVQEQQSFQGSEAHIITPAAPPTYPSSPKRLLSMVLCVFFGGLIGVAIGAWREAQDNVFRTAADVREGLGMEFLGMLPAIQSDGADTSRRSGRFGQKFLRARINSNNEAKPLPHLRSSLTGSANESTALAEIAQSQIDVSDRTLSYVVQNPRTSFAETLRGTKVVVDKFLRARPLKIVGVISMSPNEGKSTVSKNFASLVASLGASVLLIDGDMHRCGLTKKLAQHAQEGLVEVIQGKRTLDEVVMLEPRSGLNFLPAVIDSESVHSGELLTSAGMRHLLEQAGSRYEYVVIDLPPIGPSVDVRAASSLFDCFIFVVKWGQTLRHLVQTSMVTERDIADRCVGVIYNSVQFDRIQLYEVPGERHYHYQEYGMNYY